jgi:hypothetical protein
MKTEILQHDLVGGRTIKAELALCLTKHYAMKTYGAVDV